MVGSAPGGVKGGGCREAATAVAKQHAHRIRLVVGNDEVLSLLSPLRSAAKMRRGYCRRCCR